MKLGSPDSQSSLLREFQKTQELEQTGPWAHREDRERWGESRGRALLFPSFVNERAEVCDSLRVYCYKASLGLITGQKQVLQNQQTAMGPFCFSPRVTTGRKEKEIIEQHFYLQADLYFYHINPFIFSILAQNQFRGVFFLMFIFNLSPLEI